MADEGFPKPWARASIRGAPSTRAAASGRPPPYVLVLVDELATISTTPPSGGHGQSARGRQDFRFYGLANRRSGRYSCQYCIGASAEDRGCDPGHGTRSPPRFGCHHDGLKSPCVVGLSLVSEYPFLMKQEDVDENLKEADGTGQSGGLEDDARVPPPPPRPRPRSSTGHRLRPLMRPLRTLARFPSPSHLPHTRLLHTIVAGCDPAWSASGDSAIWQVVDIVVQMGVPMLCFRPPERLPIAVSSPRSPVEQLTDGVLQRLMAERNLDPRLVAYDASGNQALGDVVSMRTGGLAGLGVNNSVRASDLPIRAGSPQAARDQYYDRGSESWAVLAEFIRAGQVRGLSPEAIRQITTRRWQTKSSASSTLSFPLRMEPKEAWAARHAVRGAKSPNECDAAALAAMAAKERAGIVPWASAVPELTPAGGLPGNAAAAACPSPLSESVPEPDYDGASLDFGGYSESLL